MAQRLMGRRCRVRARRTTQALSLGLDANPHAFRHEDTRGCDVLSLRTRPPLLILGTCYVASTVPDLVGCARRAEISCTENL
eukprot:6224192-Prymnesium_polylepis.1